MTVAQLTIDGGEVELVGDVMPTGHRLGRQQRAVLRELGFRGSLRAFQAGHVIHAGRDRPCGRAPLVAMEHACCEHGSTDGSDMLRKLLKQGYVVQIGGVYYPSGR